MRTPAGVSAADFSTALAQFEAAVGKEWVFTSDEDVDLYRDAYSPFWGEPEERKASAAACAGERRAGADDRSHRQPLQDSALSDLDGPQSRLRRLRADASGSVVLDLKRMNRVLEVNERNAYALVEPGVSYFDLYRHIEERGLKVWIDVPDPGWGSLVGNALDRGGGYTTPQFRNHFDAHCGMEVVLANGELLRTGMGAMPNSKTWQQYKTGFGPCDRRHLFAVELRRRHEDGLLADAGAGRLSHGHACSCRKHDDLVAARRHPQPSREQRRLQRHERPVEPAMGLPAPYDAPAGRTRTCRPYRKPSTARRTSSRRTRQHRVAPLWSATLKFYGRRKRSSAQWEYAKEKFSAIPGAKFIDGELIKMPLTPEQKEKVHKAEFGIPSLSIFSIGARTATNPTPGDGHQWFSPIIPRTGEAVFEANRIFAEAGREFGLPVPPFSIPFCYWERSFLFLFGFPVTHDVEKNKATRAAFKQLVEIAAEHGLGEYRTAPAYQDLIMNTYSFNNHALRRFHETLKDAVDPNGILSAGRYGIWPKNLRGARK